VDDSFVPHRPPINTGAALLQQGVSHQALSLTMALFDETIDGDVEYDSNDRTHGMELMDFSDVVQANKHN
jgi:hypothetical protein